LFYSLYRSADSHLCVILADRRRFITNLRPGGSTGHCNLSTWLLLVVLLF